VNELQEFALAHPKVIASPMALGHFRRVGKWAVGLSINA
jgi:hypothetical protein